MTASSSILVTGGAGFVGSALLRYLLQTPECDSIAVLDSFSTGRREYLPDDSRLNVIHSDLNNRRQITDIVSEVRPKLVFHLAAIHFIPYCNEYPDQCLQTNVIGTQNLLDALARHVPHTVVIASSAAVYPVLGDACSEATHLPGPTDIYGLSKLVNEQQLQQFALRTKAACAAARLFNVIGPRETNPHIVPAIIDQLRQGTDSLRLGNLEPRRDYIYVDDVAAAMSAIANKNRAPFRTYNVGTGCEWSVRELAEELIGLSGRQVQIGTDPGRLRRIDRPHLLADCSRIRSEIGWTPRVSMREGLLAAWQWTSNSAEE